MNEYKTCPGCDGEGSLMYQWAKEAMVKAEGEKRMMDDGTWYYVTREGREIEFKTIGGPCSVCRGSKTVKE